MAFDILVVDDEEDIRTLVCGILEDEGYDTREASQSDQAIEAIELRCPTLVLLDIWLQNSKLDGIGILDYIKRHYPEVPVIMMSGHGTIETAVLAIKNGAYEFIEKPFQTDRLLIAVERAIEAARLRQEIEELKQRAGDEDVLLGDSIQIQQIRQLIVKVAPTGSRILISGVAGTGKEVVARSIHLASKRSNGPFIILNCAAMHPDRIESALFGIDHRDNERPSIGTLERAHNGTLVLDEIADMPLETQGKILRSLHEQTFERVGGSRKIEVDVRVIAITTKDLSNEIAQGRFREDLFYRLNIVPLHVPTLRERRQDIAYLADHFMKWASKKAGVPLRKIADDTKVALQAYNWPGNVRQLRNIIEWLVIMAPGNPTDLIRADMLPPDIRALAPAAIQLDKTGDMMSLPLRESRELFEKEYLSCQVTRFAGNISKTAQFIGMERSALHRKLKLLGLTTEDTLKK
jgi:two-component system nitrogen regulation response regulator NtrX